ncbi:hypothetical protein C1H46_011231 [Malus baccata]|uniref:Protein kinase domain-containing protein n=1 Tax=Malus baccata TaxID=106549 RepID=A0A540MXI8_MALBA|nr:hypothetical protein C1H46_011231 [Malus baccata]
MAFDQNSFPKELRPLNVAQTVAEEPRIAQATTAGRNPDRFFPSHLVREVNSPNSLPVFYQAPVASEAGNVGLGYGNAVSGVPTWCPGPRIVVPVGHPDVNPSVGVGIGYSPNLGSRVGGSAVDLVCSATTTTASGPSGCSSNMYNRSAGSGSDHGVDDMTARFGYNPNLGNKVSGNVADQTGNDLTSGYGYNANLGSRGSGTDQASDECGDDSVSGKKIKLLCSFGGKILPRPSDGMLRYVGGHTRIISVRRDVSFNDLVQKMVDTYGQPVVIKYQLPDEDLDALVSVSCADDLDNMKDEYGKLVERSPDGSAKLRVFLFSASEVDPSGVVQLGDLHNSEQRYVDAVNGITDGVSVGIARKESNASAASTQNSDFSGTDVVDNSVPGQGDNTGLPSAGKLSPKGDSATSHDTSTRLVFVDPKPAIYSEVSTIPLVIPVVKSGPPQTPSSQPEGELERSVPVTVSQQQLGLQQPGIGISSAAPYLQTYVGPRQEVMTQADHIQLPPQMGFPSPHPMGTARPVFTQQQYGDSVAGITPRHFIPAVHMTMTPSYSHVNIRPSVLQPLIHPQQAWLDNYVDKSTFVPRVVQLPAEQSYNSYQVQVPSTTAGGAYGWHQVQPPEHVIYRDGLVSHQQVMYPEKSTRFEDCYMCQNALPHAHSDNVVQVQRDIGGSPVSDSSPTYYGPRLEENLLAQPMNKVIVSGPLGEGNFGQGVEAQPRVQVPVDPLLITSYSNETGLSQISTPEGVIQRGGDVQSPNSAFMVNTPQRRQDDAVQQHPTPFQYQVKQENLVNDPFNQDVTLVGGAPVVCESPTAYDHLRQIDGRMEALRINPTEIYVNKEHGKSPGDTPRREDSFDHKTPQVGGRDVALDNIVDKFGRNHFKPTKVSASSPAEVSHGYSSQPVELCDLGQQSMWGNPESYLQSRVGMHPRDSYESNYGNPVVSTHLTNGIQPPPEWEDENMRLQPKMVPNKREVITSNGVGAQDSSNSLFSNQDPWSLRHDTQLPPRPTKIQLRKEPFTEMQMDGGGQQPMGNLNRDLSSEHAPSSKGSEEQIKQELQAVAEGVAACVFQSSTPSDSYLHDKNESAYESNRDEEVQNNAAGMKNRSESEDVKFNFADKPNLGFPVADGLGRLQIIKNSDLEELRELGSGTFGTVYHGKWRGTDVAIKRINDRCFAGKPSEQERTREDFWNEAIKLADLHHPNVVAFYGIVLDGPGGSVATVTEYMVNGSLRNALQKNEKSLDKRKRLMIAMDVAFGMEYLHEKKIVHFDLKSDNLLVNLRDPHRPICKVGDLGLSKVKCHTLISGGVRGTLPWMAPELLNGSSSLVSEKVDVFSFGIVMWELLTGDEPYADLHYGAIIGGIVSNTLRPPVPDFCDPEWKSLMETCWSAEPSERLSFTEIANELRGMAAKIPPKGQTQPQQPSPT